MSQTNNQQADHAYTAQNLKLLKGLEAVRQTPGMYIGSTSAQGLHHLVWEIVDNSIDEALQGFGDQIDIKIEPGDVISVRDHGRGIPVEIHNDTGVSGVETVFTNLHAGGKFNSEVYKVSGGLHGVGASVVNALSSWLEVTVYRDGYEYSTRFENGGTQFQPLRKIGPSDQTGTLVRFKADPSIFTETTEYNFEILNERIRQLAFLTSGLRLTLEDQREGKERSENYLYKEGLLDYVKFLNQGKEPVNESIIYAKGVKNGIQVEVALQYNQNYGTQIYSFANNIFTHEGGVHLTGFKAALSKQISKYHQKVSKKNETLSGNDILEGLTAVISIKHPNPQFEGQTKTKLGNSDVRPVLNEVFGTQLERFFDENPNQAKAILEKSLLAKKAREAASRARESTRKRNELDSITSLPGKLTDCSSQNPEETEIFIVEGNSAGGSAKQGRDAKTQAILPLRGKILNVEKAGQERIFSNAEINSMITAFGCGYLESVDTSRLRYHKIVIMTDADVDGSHIQTLILTFLYRFMREVIEEGYVYIAQPPLYKIQKGKKVAYAYREQEMDSLRKEFKDGYKVQRYKGLGEMDAEQLWETTMDPEKRVLKRVTISDAREADLVFNMLMGDDVIPRREFIQQNADYATLDL